MGIENMSESMKLIQKEMDFWRNPEVQEAEEEYAHLQEELRQEAPLFVPASKGPENAPISTPEDLNSFPAQRQNIFPIGGLEGIPATSTAQESSDGPSLSGMQEWVSALRKPYPGAPIGMSQGGFYIEGI